MPLDCFQGQDAGAILEDQQIEFDGRLYAEAPSDGKAPVHIPGIDSDDEEAQLASDVMQPNLSLQRKHPSANPPQPNPKRGRPSESPNATPNFKKFVFVQNGPQVRAERKSAIFSYPTANACLNAECTGRIARTNPIRDRPSAKLWRVESQELEPE